MQLEGRNAIITGASQGFGRVLAEMFIAEGANVMLCARSAAALEQTRAELSVNLRDGQRVLAQRCDIAQPDAVDALIDAAIAAFDDVHILINNAGVYGPMGLIEDVDWDDWVQAININLMGTVLVTRAILPHMRERNYGKIVTLSGGGATSPMPRITAYAASKAAVVRFMESLALETQAANIDVNTIAPGALNTRLLDEAIDAGPENVGEAFHKRMVEIKAQGGAPMEKGAALCVFLSSAASDGVTGKLISAIWDPWAELPQHKEDLQSDIYTIRRIIPAERGMDWGDVE